MILHIIITIIAFAVLIGATTWIIRLHNNMVLQAKKNEELRLQHDRFMANSMHSLKNLMTPLIAYTEMMMSDQLPKEKIPHVAEQLNRNTNLMVELCTELMNINRIRGGIIDITFCRVNPYKMLQEYLFMTEANFAHKQLQVVNKLDPQIDVWANSDSVSSAFLNLLTNAVKFSYTGGCITISGKIVDNKYYAISVTDEGMGLPSDNFLEEISVNGAISRPGTAGEEGTGVGLILTKDLIEKNGGTLTARNNPDKGATFTFTLPLPGKDSK